jgi:type IV secretory pathway VirB6-like protein
MLLFDETKRFFGAWIAQLANYGLITILTVMVAALLLRIVQSYAAQTAARGAAIMTVDALHMVLMAALVFLILRQVMPIASGLAGGLALNSFGFVSRGLGWGVSGSGMLLGPAVGYAAPRVMRTLGKVTEVMRNSVHEAAAQSGRYVHRGASVGMYALGESWRRFRK